MLIGAGTTTITKVAPSATSGVPLISQGAAADPIFGTVTVAGGGTGATTITGVLTGNGTSPMTASPVTQYAVLVGSTANLVNSIGPGNAGQVLQSGGGAANPAYSTATYPSTAANTGRILREDGTNWVETTATYPNTTTVNQLLYSSSTNAIGGLATANTAVLVTNSSGVPGFTTLATDGQLLIGATGGSPIGATLTAGTGITITNAANSITISAAAATPLVFHTNSGDATPSGNAVSVLGVGSMQTTGSGSTISVQLQNLTNHNVLVGAGTTTITKVAPSATSGVPLISQGAASDPIFGTAVVAGGGTGDTSFTAYAVITGGTTSTGALQNVSGLGTAAQVLTSNGAGALPSWQDASSSGGGSGSAAATMGFEDFFPGFDDAGSVATIFCNYGWTATATSVNVDTVTVSGHPGIVALTGPGGVTLYSASKLLLGSGILTLEFLARVTATGNSTVRLGLTGTDFDSTPDDGVFFSYASGTNSGKWVANTRASASGSTGNSNNTVVANQWDKLKIVINAVANSVGFFVNGTEITNSPLSTNIPTTSLRLGLGGSNLTTVPLQADYISWNYVLTTSR